MSLCTWKTCSSLLGSTHIPPARRGNAVRCRAVKARGYPSCVSVDVRKRPDHRKPGRERVRFYFHLQFRLQSIIVRKSQEHELVTSWPQSRAEINKCTHGYWSAHFRYSHTVQNLNLRNGATHNRQISLTAIKAVNKNPSRWAWWWTPLIAAFGRQRQTDFCEFKPNLVYIAHCRPGRAT